MKTVNLYLLTLIFFLIAGCATTPIEMGDYYQHPTSLPSNGMANVYIYNPHSLQNDQPVIYVDNNKTVTLPSNTYTLLSIRPGMHFFGFSADSTAKNTNTFTFGANKTYYVEYKYVANASIWIQPLAHGYTASSGSYADKRKFVLLDSYEKASSIAMCRFVKPYISGF